MLGSRRVLSGPLRFWSMGEPGNEPTNAECVPARLARRSALHSGPPAARGGDAPSEVVYVGIDERSVEIWAVHLSSSGCAFCQRASSVGHRDRWGGDATHALHRGVRIRVVEGVERVARVHCELKGLA